MGFFYDVCARGLHYRNWTLNIEKQCLNIGFLVLDIRTSEHQTSGHQDIGFAVAKPLEVV